MTKVLRYVVLGALFAIPFLPLYVANGLFFPFITGKHFLFRILVEVAFVGWGILMLTDARYRPRFSWTLVLYGAFALWMLVADLLAVNSHKALWSNYERMDGWVTLAHVFALFLIAGAVLSAENLRRRWWLTFVGASAFVCAYGLLQVMGLLEIHQGGVRLDASMGNAAYLASYLLFSVFATVWLALRSGKSLRLALLVLSIVQVVLLFLTATRGAILALVLVFGLSVAVYTFMQKGRARVIGVGVVLLGLTLAGSLYLARDAQWVREEPTLSRLSSISLADASTRFALWGMAAKGVAERPVFGWGQEGFNYIFNENYVPSLYAQEPWFDRAHNVFIDWLVAGGIPAFLLFVALLGSAVRVYWKQENRIERLILTGAIVAYAVQASFVFDNLFSYVPLAMLLAMAHGISSKKIEKAESVKVVSPHTIQTIVAPVGAVIAIVLVWSVNVPSMLAGGDLIRALSPWPSAEVNLEAFESAVSRGSFATQEIREQWVNYSTTLSGSTNVPADLRMHITRRAVEELGKEVERAPRDARLRLEYSYAYRAFGDFARAQEEIKTAQALSPKKQSLMLEEGILAWQSGDFMGARDAFRRAYEVDPSFDDLALYVAAGEIRAGNPGAGLSLLEERFGTTTLSHGVLMLAYYDTKDYERLFASLRTKITETRGDITAYYQLASAYAETGRTEEARGVLREALAAHPELSAQIMQFVTSLGTPSP